MPITGVGGNEFPQIGIIRKGSAKNEKGEVGEDLGPYLRMVFEEDEQGPGKAQERFEKIYHTLQPEEIDVTFTVDHYNDGDTWRYWLEAYDRGAMVMQTDGEWVQYKRDRKTGRAIVRNGRHVETGNRVPYDGGPAYTYYSKKKNEEVEVYPTPHGYLRVLIPGLRRLAYLEVRTTSWYDCDNITKNLNAIIGTHGSLKGVPCILRRRPREISKPLPDGRRFREVEWLIFVEVVENWADDKFQQLEAGAYASPSYKALNSGQAEMNPEGAHEPVVEIPKSTAAVDPHSGAGVEGEVADPQEKAKRPLDPETVREFVHRRAEQAGNGSAPATEKQAQYLAHKFQEAFAPAKDAEKRYHLSLFWLWGVDSAKKLTITQARVTLDWLLKGGADDTGDTPLHEHAPAEAAGVYREALKAQGQQEMKLAELGDDDIAELS